MEDIFTSRLKNCV